MSILLPKWSKARSISFMLSHSYIIVTLDRKFSCGDTFDKDAVNDILETLLSTLPVVSEDRNSYETSLLTVKLTLTSRNLTSSDVSGITAIQTDYTPNGLCHLNHWQTTQQDGMSKTRAIDTLSKNAVVEDHKLESRILTPLGQGVEEHITTNFVAVDVSSVLGSDVKHVVTHSSKLRDNISVVEKTPQNLSVRCCHQNLLGMIVIKITDNIHQHLTIIVSSSKRLLTLEVNFVCLNRGRQNAAILNQFSSRHTDQLRTINISIVHTIGARILVILRRSSKEVCVVCVTSNVSNYREEITTNAIVCFVKVNEVHINLTLNNTIERLIGGKNDTVSASSVAHILEQTNTLRFGSVEVISLTAVNVANNGVHSAIQSRPELFTELVSKQNTRSNNYNSLRVDSSQKTTLSVFDSNKSLTTRRREDDTTSVMLEHDIQSTFLVGSKSHGNHECPYSIGSSGALCAASVPVYEVSLIKAKFHPILAHHLFPCKFSFFCCIGLPI